MKLKDKPLTLAIVTNILNDFNSGEITLTRVTEKLNEKIGYHYLKHNQWLDMDSAPKDGTEIQIYDKELGIKQATWLYNDYLSSHQDPTLFAWCNSDSWNDEQGGFTTYNPIKWKPLPDKPNIN